MAERDNLRVFHKLIKRIEFIIEEMKDPSYSELRIIDGIDRYGVVLLKEVLREMKQELTP